MIITAALYFELSQLRLLFFCVITAALSFEVITAALFFCVLTAALYFEVITAALSFEQSRALSFDLLWLPSTLSNDSYPLFCVITAALSFK